MVLLGAGEGRKQWWVWGLEPHCLPTPPAQEHRGLLALRYPMEHGVVRDWNDMERIWQYVYSKDQLQTFSEEVWQPGLPRLPIPSLCPPCCAPSGPGSHIACVLLGPAASSLCGEHNGWGGQADTSRESGLWERNCQQVTGQCP